MMQKIVSTAGLTRRRGLAAAATVLAAGMAALPTPAVMAAKRKVKLVSGAGAIDSSDVGFFSSIPIGAGFYADEGIDAEVFSVNGSSAAVNLLASGQVQFTNQSNGGLFAGVDKGVPMIAFICQIPDNFFALAVPAGSRIRTVEDLKGKTIGVPSVGGGTVVMMKAVARQIGWINDKDIEYLAVGGGLPALDALQRDRVQALFLWSSPYGLFEGNGAKLTYFVPQPLPQLGFTQTTNVTLQLIKDDPALVAAMARALARSLVFMAAAQPEELTKLHFRVFPDTKPPGLNEADVLRVDRSRLLKQIGYMRFPQRVFERTEKLGDARDVVIEEVRDLLHDGGEIKQALPVDRYFTRRFLADMNNIDFDGIIARAKAFRA